MTCPHQLCTTEWCTWEMWHNMGKYKIPSELGFGGGCYSEADCFLTCHVRKAFNMAGFAYRTSSVFWYNHSMDNMVKEKLGVYHLSYLSQKLSLDGLIFKPTKARRSPGVIFIHGHESDCWRSSLYGYFLQRSGFAAFLPSQVGYGLSEGEADYCGPKTIRGVIDGINIFFAKVLLIEKQSVYGVYQEVRL